MHLIQASTFARLFFHTLPFFLRVGGQSLELQVSKLQSECGILYTVVAGDGCWAIAENAHITQAQLTALNPGLDCGTIGIGDGLCLGLPCGQTYEVAMGDWCAKIQDEQGVTESDLISLNPGLACEELFPGQHLCIAPPVVDPPTEPGETPPDLPPLFPDPVPVVPCNIQVPIALGDTCSDLATSNHIQLSQFTALNENLDCDNLSPGNIACVAPGCRTIYRVQSGDWCSKIEGDFSLTAGQLTGLNNGLSCENLAPDQVLCVEPPDETEEESPEPGITYANDSQHRAAFSRLDANSDGKIDLNELNEIISASPRLTRGTTEVVDSLTHSEFAQRLMEAADTNEDGFINEDEYMRAIVSSQNITSYATDLAFEASQNGDVSERAIPLLVVGAGLLLGLFVSMSFVDLMHHLEAKARVKAGDMLKYLDVTFWERGKEDEPKCSAYMYYSTSCAALGHHWSSHCSEGGEKVFDKSCRVPFADGAKACGFLGCSSLCYKVSTEGCDCDALKYHAEEGVAYNDPPISTTDEIGVGACRRRCRDTSGCIGWEIIQRRTWK
ncbi:hypothetical protein ONZ45_g16083 [Pleurotus djamor]|nr:hypothetical protein ONZ45_g16083 [Pleurotus djamor]